MKVSLDAQKCVNCKLCEAVCPHRVFSSQSGKMEIVAEERCIECGACQMNCPTWAIRVDTGVG